MPENGSVRPEPSPSGRRITVVGSLNVDLVAHCARLPRPGETIQAAELDRYPGGKGANQAVAAARLGAEVRMVGAVGDDEFGRELLGAVRANGVDSGGVSVVSAPTGIAVVLVDAGGENEIVVAPGANALLGPDLITLEGHDAVLCQLEVPLEAVAFAARGCRGLFCLNAAPARSVPDEVLARADLVVVNQLELDALGARPAKLVAVTLGAEGAVLLCRGEEIARASPPPVVVIDGTAAGDAFTASLVVSLLEGRDPGPALARACAAGAIAASRWGAQPSLPTAAEIDELVPA